MALPIQSSSYAEKTRRKITPITSIQNPTDEQGIIFNHIGEHKIRDYLLAISEQVGGAQNIVAASRVSSGKVIIFLNSKQLVDTFQEEKGGFQLGPAFVPTKKLKAPATKLIISNVSPTIPNTTLEEILIKTLQLNLVSPISFLRVNPKDDIFAHVISWRRQVYLSPNEDCSKIPPLIEITHASRSYRIFFSADNLACFKCGVKGHKAEDCTKNSEDITEDSFPPNAEMANSGTKTVITETATPQSSSEFPPLPSKRVLPSTTSSNSDEQNLLEINNTGAQNSSIQHSIKRQKTDPNSTLADQISAATGNTPIDVPALTLKQLADQLKPLYADPTKYKPPLSADNLASYIDSCKNPSKDAIPNLQKYSVPIAQITPALQKSHSIIQNTKSKGRITRIMTALNPKPTLIRIQLTFFIKIFFFIFIYIFKLYIVIILILIMAFILNWNCNGFFTHYEDFKLLLHTYAPSIICLQETHFKSNFSPTIPNYSSFTVWPAQNVVAHGGVTLAVSSKLHAHRISLNTNLQAVAVQILAPQKITVCTIYLPPNIPLLQSDFNALLEQLPSPLILTGDFNSHHQLFGSTHTNTRGQIIYDAIEMFNLTLLNTTPTHFNFTHHTWSLLDLIVSSTQLSSQFDVQYHTDLSGSDHTPLIVQNLHTPRDSYQNSFTYKMNHHKINWELFYKTGASSSIITPLITNIDDATDYISTTLLQIAAACSPQLYPTSGQHSRYFHRKPVPWWNESCAEALKNRKLALRHLKLNPSTESLINFKKMRAKAK